MFRRIITLLVLLYPAIIMAETTLEVKVVAIADGDTLTLLVEQVQHKIRLADIDTPERKQPWYQKAKDALSELVFSKDVSVRVTKKDRYGRWIGRVFVNEIDVNAELVRNGHAWVYKKYAKDPMLYQLEDEARASQKGLWSLPESERIPPWEWRRSKRK
jgi:micrococcal nuclease